MSARRIIIDCDPGQDDAVALLLAFGARNEMEVAGICTVAGNVPLHHTLRNALRIRTLAGRDDVPVFAGCPRPILSPLSTAEEVHGETGLDGVELPEPSADADARHAVSFMIDACREAGPRGMTLCPVGPLTNIAAAIVMAPDICGNIREIVMMGGAACVPGNITPAAEFNIFVDPHAARIVFESGVRIVMLGLDVTHQAIATPARREAIEAVGTPAAIAVGQMLAFYDRCDIEKYGAPGAPLHDPCAIAYVLRPELFSGRDCHVAIETAPGPALGQTVTDWWTRTGNPPNCHVVTQVDADGLFALLTTYLGRV